MTQDASQMPEQEPRRIMKDSGTACRQALWRNDIPGIMAALQSRPLLFWKKMADTGIPEAQWFVAMCYEYAAGVPQDDAEAVAWYLKAAEQGHPLGQDSFADCLYNGAGIERDTAAAVKWYRAAADQGLPEAQHSLGICLFNGEGVKEDYKEAASWFRKAAEQGYPSAQYALGDSLLNGDGIEENTSEAIELFRAAADQGNAEAQNRLGLCLQEGTGIDANEDEAIKWYRLAADQGNTDAQYNLGLCYANGSGVPHDIKEAVSWFRKAAEQGDAVAQNELGEYLLYGVDIEHNETEAVQWFRAAAEQDNADAQNRLGLLHDQGKVVPRDRATAASWYRKAADQEFPVAQCNLGISYEYGHGVAKDLVKAAEWYRKSADNGYPSAQYRLGCCYLDGKGLTRDEQEGVQWLQKAAEQSHAAATRRLNKLHAGTPETPEHEPPEEEPEQDSPVPQRPTVPPTTEHEADTQTADSDVTPELTVAQCMCGRLTSSPYDVNGGACACPSCHARINIPPGPNPKTYLITDISPDRKEDTPQRIYLSSKLAIVTIVTADGIGSGFFLTSDGLIITNNHVVDGYASVMVKQSNAASIRGRVIRSFHRLDLAFIKVRMSRLTPFLRVAQSDQIQVGDDAFAIGSPHDFEGTFTEGIISSNDRVIGGCHFIQTDAPISPGNSGGPLLNAYGEAVGVNTLSRNRAQNINFAIPASVVRACLYEVAASNSADKTYCRVCGHASADAVYCDTCGAKFEAPDADAVPETPQEKPKTNNACQVCGAKLAPNTQYCPRCGTSSKKEASS